MARTPEVWYAIPSANPVKCRETLPAWRDMGYRVAVLQNYEHGDIPADICEWSDTYPGWARSINILAKRVVPRSAGIIVSGGDDMLPDPNLTASEIAEQFFERFPDGFGVMQPVGDDYMWAPHYCGSPWLGRLFCDLMYQGRGPMCEGYAHNWADNELHWVARGLNALWKRRDLSQRHEHFTRRGEDKPAYWASAVQSKDKLDVELYIARKWADWPGHEPLPGPSGKVWKYDPAPLREGDNRLAEHHWTERYSPDRVTKPCVVRTREAMESCHRRGLARVALYGAGAHTRQLSSLLMEPPVNLVCIIDDNESLRGRRLWGYPILTRDEALREGVEAVILSSDSNEDALWEQSGTLRAAGVEVLRLYADGASLAPVAMSRSSHAPSRKSA